MKNKIATLTIRKWGNSLAVRIPIEIAHRAHFEAGTPVEVALQEDGITVKSIGEKELTLDEMLKKFEPEKHRGEAMPSGLIGLEKF
jgi:antitoxin MazE